MLAHHPNHISEEPRTSGKGQALAMHELRHLLLIAAVARVIVN